MRPRSPGSRAPADASPGTATPQGSTPGAQPLGTGRASNPARNRRGFRTPFFSKQMEKTTKKIKNMLQMAQMKLLNALLRASKQGKHSQLSLTFQ